MALSKEWDMGTKTNKDATKSEVSTVEDAGQKSSDGLVLNNPEETATAVSSSVSGSPVSDSSGDLNDEKQVVSPQKESDASEEQLTEVRQETAESDSNNQGASEKAGSTPTAVDETEKDTPNQGEPIEDDSKVEPIVETIYLDDSKVGIQYSNYPLSSSVLKALNEMGHQYLSRYQQTLLDCFTLGDERWFSVNLASNRGLIVGTYLVDLAQTDLTKTTSVLCVAVPKIRSYFERDLLAIAKYTGVRILSVSDDVYDVDDASIVDEVPNIVIASIENIARLKEKLDFSTVEVLYFDEVEKTIRDAENVFVDFVNEGFGGQVLMQSSYYSEALIETIHKCKPNLNPTRIFKIHKNSPAIYSLQGTDEDVNWQEGLEHIVPHYLLQRLVIISAVDGKSIADWLRIRGWDVYDATNHAEIPANVVEDLKENRVQIVILHQEHLQQSTLEFEVLVQLDDINGEEQTLIKKNKRLQAMFYKGKIGDTLAGAVVSPLSDLTAIKHSQRVGHSLRQNVLNGTNSDWGDMVDDLLAQPDGKQLIGEALRLALQHKRGEQGYIRSSVYKLENRDVFQRRNRRKSR